MPVKALLLLSSLLIFSIPVAANDSSPLRNHVSPYLAMHADDPVQWQLWGREVLERAQKEQKLLFVSSGYFACHWCHVMQRESFQQETIAGLLNSVFIPVKLDRELSPELDDHLIEFVDQTRGVAGWPLNVFLTPQGHPLIGSGYLPADEFLVLIKRLQVRWENDGAGLSRLAAEAANKVANSVALSPEMSRRDAAALSQQLLFEHLFSEADLLAGGLGDGAKFPQVPLLRALMAQPAEEELDEFIMLTLSQMAENGLRDHIGGGFFRYTVDPGWHEPHFEKMLYDNAQLITLYFEAAQRWRDDAWGELAMATLDAVLRTFSHPDGGFISSLSSLDEKGQEGGYYLWQQSELDELLPVAERHIFNRAWRLQSSSEWSGLLPIEVMDDTALASSFRMTLKEASQWRKQVRQRVFEQRLKRQLPQDNKRLAGWNGLMLSALARGAKTSDKYKAVGSQQARFLRSLWDGEQLWRLRDKEGSGVTASLEDYAYVAQGLLDWAEAIGDDDSRRLASRLTGTAFYRYFRDGLWQPGEDSAVLMPPRRLLRDGALPSPAVIIASLGRRFGEASPLIPKQINAILFADPVALSEAPLDYPSYFAEIREQEKRGTRLNFE